MSIDLFAFAQSEEPILRKVLAEKMGNEGWGICFSQYPSTVLKAGPIGNDTVWGTRTANVIERVKAHIARYGEDALEKEFTVYEVGGCSLIASPFDIDDDDEDLPEVRACAGEEGVELLKNARTFYSLTTSASRNTLSSRLQDALWEAIGDLITGVLEEPQMGKYTRVERGERRELRGTGKVEKNETDEMQPRLISFLTGVQAIGFPIEGGPAQGKPFVVKASEF